jgi:uncharacterized protein YecE (DUF72 family)
VVSGAPADGEAISGRGRCRSMAGRLRVGTSGWIYKHWIGDFYPPGVRAADRLAYYATRFDTAEINASFYRLPAETTVAGWAATAPPGFVFAWKASRFITQAKKLKDPAGPLALVYGRMRPLGDKLGPALFQLPPQLRLNLERLETFLALLPPGTRNTIEFRHPSWYVDPVLEALSRHDVALCISDHHDAPGPWVRTASWAYIRGHGPGGHYVGRYPADALGVWAARIRPWLAQGCDVYAYFDNDIGCAAPADAEALIALL